MKIFNGKQEKLGIAELFFHKLLKIDIEYHFVKETSEARRRSPVAYEIVREVRAQRSITKFI